MRLRLVKRGQKPCETAMVGWWAHSCVAGTATRFADADRMARARAAILAGARAVTGILGGRAELFDA